MRTGDTVVYLRVGQAAEIGVVTHVPDDEQARVLFLGCRTAKLTRLEDLDECKQWSDGQTFHAWCSAKTPVPVEEPPK